jgi:hypothetical protein
MSISFGANDPNRLFASFTQAIDNHKHGRPAPRIDTWRYVLHQQRYFFTHTSQNWGDKAWLLAAPENGHLVFYVRPFENVRLTRDTYAYYVGHLAETFIRHFPTTMSLGQVTPSASGADTAF